MKIAMEDIPLSPIAYIRRTGAYGIENIQTMEQLKCWASANHLMNDETVIYGIAHDNPQMTPPEECRYDACIVLTATQLPEKNGVQLGEITGGKYAVFTTEHTAEAVKQLWTELFPALAENHCSLDSARPILERFAAKMISQHLCEICVPVIE